MTTNISIDQYCSNPSLYQNQLSNNIIKNWNQICSAKKQLNNIKFNINDLLNIGENSLIKFIESMLNPQSLMIIGAILGITLSVKSLYTLTLNWLTKGLSENVLIAGEEAIAEGASIASANASVIFDSFMSEGILAAVESGNLGIYSLGLLLQSAKVLGKLLEFVGLVLMVLQVIGIIFDTWDPCNLNKELDANSFQLYNNNFNKVFRENVLISLESMTDSYNRQYWIYVWPIEFFADRGILSSQKEDYYSILRTKYCIRYLNALDFNSNGEPIYWPNGGNFINNDKFAKIIKTIGISLSDNNTIIANWIIKFWPLLIFLLFLILIIIFMN